jgi:tetratricopeptide (TPR) repeat protein
VLRLSDSGNDSTLMTLDGSARGRDALIPTLDRLARRMRRELGENPGAVRATRNLQVIATPSFEAYRKVVQAVEYHDATNDAAGSMALVREALALDPDCAMAYDEAADDYSSLGKADSAVWACDQALMKPRRLTDEQRLHVEAERAFFRGDLEGAVQLRTRQLQLYPSGPMAAQTYSSRGYENSLLGRNAEALEDGRRSIGTYPVRPSQVSLFNLFAYEWGAGQLAQAESTLSQLRGAPHQRGALVLAWKRGDWARAESLCANPPADVANNRIWQFRVAVFRISLFARRGQMRAAQDLLARRIPLEELHRPGSLSHSDALFFAMVSHTRIPAPPVALAGDMAARSVITRCWHAALAGDVPVARRELAELRRRSAEDLARSGAAAEFLDASIAAAENRWSEVVRIIGPVAWRADDGPFGWGRVNPNAKRWLLAEAYDHFDPPDSAAATYQRVLDENREFSSFTPYAHQRLVMIYARMGRREDAEQHWRAFSAEFTNPDPEVKHLLDEARAAIAGLRAMSPRKG